MRHNLGERYFRPERSLPANLLHGRRGLQRAQRAPVPVNETQVRRALLKALPLQVRTGSRVEIEVSVK